MSFVVTLVKYPRAGKHEGAAAFANTYMLQSNYPRGKSHAHKHLLAHSRTHSRTSIIFEMNSHLFPGVSPQFDDLSYEELCDCLNRFTSTQTDSTSSSVVTRIDEINQRDDVLKQQVRVVLPKIHTL